MQQLSTIKVSFFSMLLLFSISIWAVDLLDFQSAEEADQFRELAAEIRCLVCQNQSLADSDAPLAQDLRREVLEQMRAGHSDEEIREYLVARYSDFVLYRPSLSASNLILWFAPLLMVVAGVWLVVRQFKQANSPSDNNDTTSD